MTMETVINVKCDGENCDHVRSKDTNHWLVGTVARRTSCILLAANRENLKGKGFQDDKIYDFCGEECGIKWVSKMLTEIRNKQDGVFDEKEENKKA